MRTPCIASIAGPIFRNYRLNTDAGQDGRSTSVKKMSVGQPRDSLPVLLAGRLTQRGLFRHSYGDGRRRECDPGLSCRGQHLSRQDRTDLNDETQERINCLPATFKSDGVCGVKWVSVFPPNPAKNGIQNLSAVVILSEIEHGFPIAFMEGTLGSNIRVGAMGALADRYLARDDATTIGFIGAGEQAKMQRT